jgi:hypothetical protein
LILETYQMPIGTEMLLNIEIHLELLNRQGRIEDAAVFIRECEIGARTEVQKRSRQKSRDVLKLIGTSTFTASLGVVMKYLSNKLGIS